MNFSYKTKGTCSSQIEFELLDDNTVSAVRFTGGCNGNLKAISKLVEGLPADKVIDLLAGNTCGLRPTSCADQLARAVKEAVAAKSNA